MIQLLPEQLKALRQLKEACDEEKVDAVIIGATAYRVWVDDDRRTQDVDVALAADVDQLALVTDHLAALGWTHDQRREQRWVTQDGARVDLLPMGVRARRIGYVDWPKAEMRMSAVGFDHVFADAVEVELAHSLFLRVAPLTVLALLKAVSYMDAPNERAKDLEDFDRLMSEYELEGERRFSDEVFEAGVDFDSAGAFLLGIRVAGLCTAAEAEIVGKLIRTLQDEDRTARKSSVGDIDLLATAARNRADAFARGFELGWHTNNRTD